MPTENENGCTMAMTPRPVWRDRLAGRIFPARPLPWAEGPHGLTSDHWIVLSWRDRLRVMLGGVIRVRSIIDLASEPGRVLRTHAYTEVRRPQLAPSRPADAD